jgi:Kef-type K+ transport system membrane component KefB
VSGGSIEIPAIVLLDLAVIVVAARVAANLFRSFGQPAVIGEIVAGIVLGPTVLGAFPGDPSTDLFPPDARPALKVIGDLGLIIFIFTVGLHLDLGRVRRIDRALGIAAASIALPFGLGILLGAGLYATHDTVGGETVEHVPFLLFIGVVMSITAFPVLARILLEHGMQRTHVGSLVLACAAINDVLAWVVLTAALAALGVGTEPSAAAALLEAAAFAVAGVTVVRVAVLGPIAARISSPGRLTPGLLAVVLAVVIGAAWITAEIGVSFAFGAFLIGVAYPRARARELLDALSERLEALVTVLLLPVFFVLPGLAVNARDLGFDELGELALIMLVACVGKIVGAGGTARLLGSGWRESGAIGVLMNTRGAMELIVLTIGLEAGALDSDLYTLLVLMTILTTLMTAPLLRRIYPPELVERASAVEDRRAPVPVVAPTLTE